MKTSICGTIPRGWKGRNDGMPEAGYLTAVRSLCPQPAEGFTANDADLIIRTFDPKGDQTGRFFMLEFKYGDAGLTGSQRRLFGMLDDLLRAGDCELYDCGRYLGYFVVNYETDCWNVECPDADKPGHGYLVNGAYISLENVLDFLCGRLEIQAEPLNKPKVQLTWQDVRP